MEQGWIKLHRKILQNPLARRPTWAWLWIVLLLKANHEPEKFMWDGGILEVNSGQLLTGRKKLSEQTGIPESSIEDILKFLERQHQIRQQKTSKYRLITVLNWKEYQIPDSKSNNKATTKQQQPDTNKNEKNEKNVRKIGESPPSTKFLKPSLEEIQAYCSERKNNVSPQKFFDYYESNGWRVGRNQMKDWRAAVRTWEKNEFNTKKSEVYKNQGVSSLVEKLQAKTIK